MVGYGGLEFLLLSHEPHQRVTCQNKASGSIGKSRVCSRDVFGRRKESQLIQSTISYKNYLLSPYCIKKTHQFIPVANLGMVT